MSVHPSIHHHLEELQERGFQLKLSDEQLSFAPPLYGPHWHDRTKIGQVKEYRIPLLLLNVAKVGLGLYIDINDWRRDYRKTSLRALEFMAAYAGVHFPLTEARLVGKGNKQVEFQLDDEVGLTDVITQEAPEGLLEPINRLLRGQGSAFRWVMLGDFSTSRSGVCSYRLAFVPTQLLHAHSEYLSIHRPGCHLPAPSDAPAPAFRFWKRGRWINRMS